ncbi:MAG: DUF3379 family protein [Burkholderiales bacterium]
MNCFEFRRLIFAEPRRLLSKQKQHMEQCVACAALAKEMEGFEAKIHEAMMVPVPEALAERVLLRHKTIRPSMKFGFRPRFGGWALAASVIVAIAVSFYLDYRTADEEPQVVAAVALGSNHPAVAAISYVLDNEPKLLKANHTGDMAVLLSALEKMKMRLPANGTTVRYLGKCPVPNGEGDHVVLQTPFGRASLILVPDQIFASSVVVADRNMLALAAPTRSRNGSLILVTNSVKTLKRFEAILM